MKKYPAILGALYNTPHLITPNKFGEIESFLRRRAGGEPSAFEFSRETGEPMAQLVSATTGETLAIDQMPAAGQVQQEFVAVLPLFGTLWQHGGMELEYSGGTSTERWSRQFRRLDQNAAVKTIVIETHSPGGQCIGVMECADMVRAAREAGRTRIVSVANSQMASAAVWIGTAANEVFVTPGGEIGSVGVVSMHVDYSEQDKAAGVKYTLIATSRAKILGNEYEPLDDEARAMFESDNQVVYQRFVKAMAANRKVTTSKVEKDFGGGGMLWAKEAVAAGLADGVATMPEVLEREVSRLNKAGRKNAKNKLALAKAQLES